MTDKLPAVILGAYCAIGSGLGANTALAGDIGPVRFVPVDVFVDSGREQLAAYQVEVEVVAGDAQIVGVEGGEHPAFVNPPYYDAKALMGGRIILAAFSTSPELPDGRHRAFTLHVREAGGAVKYRLKLVAAGDGSGDELPATVSLERRRIDP